MIYIYLHCLYRTSCTNIWLYLLYLFVSTIFYGKMTWSTPQCWPFRNWCSRSLWDFCHSKKKLWRCFMVCTTGIFSIIYIKGSKAIKRLRCFHVTLARRMSCVVCPLDLAKRPSLCLRRGKCWCEVGQWQEILNKRMLVGIQIINSSRPQYNPGRSVLAIQSFFL